MARTDEKAACRLWHITGKMLALAGNIFSPSASKCKPRNYPRVGTAETATMPGKRYVFFLLAGIAVALGGLPPRTWAGDLKITIPRRSHPTPVQRLNQDGVEAVGKHQYQKAETLFYKAYLYDPADPFTLYNLGYISELEGQLERAKSFYALASQQATDAVIGRADSSALKGKPMRAALDGLQDARMHINRDNVEAIRLLSQGRASEAEVLLRQNLAADPHNAFTLNNLGVALEAEGKWEDALTYYAVAARSGSAEPVVVTLNGAWKGKPVSEMAAQSEKKLRERMGTREAVQSQAARLALRGVSAVNHNDWQEADQDFRRAYALDPSSAISLNNAGFLAERNGDLETAQFFYEKARHAPDANRRISLASRRSAEGMPLFSVAEDSDQKVDAKMTAETAARRRQQGPIQLKRRDGTPIPQPQSSPETPQQVPRPPQPTSSPEGSQPQ
jgi:Flp pilus assembly protein TadD